MKLYEKDPSKLTSIDEAIPAVSTSSDLSDDEEDNNLLEIKEEPMETVPVVPNMSLAPPSHPGLEAEQSTDSDTVREKSQHQLTTLILSSGITKEPPGRQTSPDARFPGPAPP